MKSRGKNIGLGVSRIMYESCLYKLLTLNMGDPPSLTFLIFE